MKKLIWVVFFFLTISSLSYGQSDPYNIIGNGARAAAMGNAFTGVADDATAISWNPAGLTQLKAPEASVVTRFGFGSIDVGLPSSVTALGIDQTAESEIPFSFNFGSIIYPLKLGDRPMVVGIAFRKAFDPAGKVTVTTEGPSGTTSFFLDKQGGVNAISPSIAYQITSQISAGATFDIFSGSVDEELTSNPPDLGDYSFTSDYSGSAIEAGVLAKLSKQFSLGFHSMIPFTITVDEEGFKYDIEFPFMFSAGIGFQVTDNFLLAADYRSRPLSGLRFDGQTYADWYFDNYGVIVANPEDITSFHVGGEYLLTLGDMILPVRAGFSTAPSSNVDDNGDQISGTVISFGGGLIFSSFTIDLAYEFYSANYPAFEFLTEDVSFDEKFSKITIGGVFHLKK